jgi:hypothetical protein
MSSTLTGGDSLANTKVLAQRAGRRKTDRKKRLDELGEKLSALLLLMTRRAGPAGSDDFIQLQPAWQQVVADVLEKHAVIVGSR